MNRLLYVTVLLILLMGLMYGCASSHKTLQKDMSGEVVHDTFTIKPSRSYEECIELRPGMSFDYEFTSSKKVNFNIHYHGEDKIHYPVNESGIKRDRGFVDPADHEFYIEDQEAYCLMWDNISYEPVKVSFTCVLKEEK